MKNMKKSIVIGALGLALFLTGCGDEKDTATSDSKDKSNDEVSAAVNDEKETTIIPAHQDLNQEPIPIKFERVGEHKVNIEMTAQITDIEIAPNEIYKAWTFNGEAPGPFIVVNEGDTMNFTLKNMDPAIPHSMDLHAVETSPTKNFIDIMPDESGTFTFAANRPGVFMYHCATGPALSHIANGMHGVVIVQPKDGYPTDDIVDKEFVLIQNEWYDYNSMEDFTDGEPNQVVFSAKALNEGDRNTNGDTFSLKDEPLQAKVGDRVRIYVNNVGPNEVSSFHVVGAQFDVTYLDGNPENVLKGMQTIQLPASGGAVVEFEVFEEGDNTIVTHQFEHVEKGAAAILRVTE